MVRSLNLLANSRLILLFFWTKRCNNATNVKKPVFVMEPHNAPLDLHWAAPNKPFPISNNATHHILFVSLHGSWNRSPPSVKKKTFPLSNIHKHQKKGYRVSYIEFDENYNPLHKKEIPLFAFNSTTQETGAVRT